jgi:hypothetical protein
MFGQLPEELCPAEVLFCLGSGFLTATSQTWVILILMRHSLAEVVNHLDSKWF